MMAAITASKNGNEVYLLEKNDRLGKKLLITGKGRCNITSSLDIKDFIQNVPGNGRFLYSAFDNYTNLDIINFLKEHGVSVKEERGNRIFPTSDKSLDVLKAFEAELKNKRVKIKFNTRVVGIETKEKGSHAGRKYGTRAFLKTYKESRPVVCGNQTYPCGQVGALSPVSRFLIEPSWSTHDGEVCNPPTNSKLPLND